MKYPALLFCLLAFASCKKKDTSPTIDFGPGEGITQRDASNRSTGATDPTDWTADDTWTETEAKLFTLSLDLKGPSPRGVQPRVFYPNPATTKGGGAFGFYNIPSGTMWQMVFVDKNYNVVQRLEYGPFQISNAVFSIDFPADKFLPNTTYRMYYVIYSANPATLHLKGHGDIKIGE